MSEFIQLGYHLKEEIEALYKQAKIVLDKDNSDEKAYLVGKLESFLGLPRFTIGDLNNLYAIFIQYLRSSNKETKIEIYLAAEAIANNILVMMNNYKIGYSNLFTTNGLKDHFFGASYSNIISQIKEEVASHGYSSRANLISAIARSLNSVKDNSLNNMMIDYYYGGLLGEEIQPKMSSITIPDNNVDQYILASNIYNALSNGKTLSYIPTVIELLELVNDSYLSSSQILSNLKNFITSNIIPNSSIYLLSILIVASVTNSQVNDLDDLQEIVLNHKLLVSKLILDMEVSAKSVDEIKSNILAMDENSNQYKLVVGIYNSFNAFGESAVSGATDLISAIYNVEEADNLVDIQSSIYNLNTDEFNSHKELALAIASILGSLDTSLLKNLALDMAASGNQVSTITNNLQYVNGVANPANIAYEVYRAFYLGSHYSQLASSIENHLSLTSTVAQDFVSSIQQLSVSSNINNYSDLAYSIASLIEPYSSDLAAGLFTDLENIPISIDKTKNYLEYINGQSASDVAASMYYAWSTSYLSMMKGAQALASALEENNIHSSDIRDYFTNNNVISHRFDETDKYAISTSIAKSITGNVDNSNLINSLYQDLAYSNQEPSTIINILKNINGEDEIAITANLYRSLNFPELSGERGMLDLANAIKEYHDSDYIQSLNSVLGDTDVAPKAKYLNKCLKEGDTYSVVGSIFYRYDDSASGKALSEMKDLYTVTGREYATTQCSQYMINNYVYGLYLTTTKPAGVVGNSEQTGCTELLSPSVFMAYCESVFTDIENII